MRATGRKPSALNQHPGRNNEATLVETTLVERGWGFVGAVMVLVALAMPSFGPVVDHHFAERQFHHGHLLLDGLAAEHDHSLGNRYHQHPSGAGSGRSGASYGAGMVYLNSADGGSPPVVPTATASQTSPVYPDLNRAALRPQNSPDNAPLTEAFPALPTPPPRA